MMLNDVHVGITKFKKRRRIGRGPGSGHGKTAARGHKGAKSRAGYSRHPIFQGGAMPMIRRVPKRGFNNKWADSVAIVNVGDIERRYNAGDEVNPQTLAEKGIAKGQYDVLKVLGKGDLTKKVTVSAHRFSKSAQELIEKAGGTINVLPGKTSVEEKKQAKKAEKAKAKK